MPHVCLSPSVEGHLGCLRHSGFGSRAAVNTGTRVLSCSTGLTPSRSPRLPLLSGRCSCPRSPLKAGPATRLLPHAPAPRAVSSPSQFQLPGPTTLKKGRLQPPSLGSIWPQAQRSQLHCRGHRQEVPSRALKPPRRLAPSACGAPLAP